MQDKTTTNNMRAVTIFDRILSSLFALICEPDGNSGLLIIKGLQNSSRSDAGLRLWYTQPPRERIGFYQSDNQNSARHDIRCVTSLMAADRHADERVPTRLIWDGRLKRLRNVAGQLSKTWVLWNVTSNSPPAATLSPSPSLCSFIPLSFVVQFSIVRPITC